VWHINNTAAQNGNYNVSIHPLDSSGNAGAGFTFYSTDQPLGAGGGIAVTATDQGANTLSAGTYLLRIQFFNKTRTDRYSIDDVSIEGATGQPSAPQVSPGSPPEAQPGVAANLSGSSSASATWSLVSGPGTATFDNASSPYTTVTFSAAGIYVLRLTSTDETATVYQNLTVTVTSPNTEPTISTVAAQTIPINGTTGALAFTIDDAQTPAGSLTVTATSSNNSLVPNGNLALGGTGANRTITVVPAANQTGTTTITLSVSDGTLSAQSTFTVTVTETMTSWISSQPGVGSLAAHTDDPDGDGLPNLLEFAFGSAPGNPASGIAPVPGMDSSNRLTLTFTPHRVAGLSYIIEASNDLSSWSDTDVTAYLTAGQPFTYTDDTTVTTRRFLRLRVLSLWDAPAPDDAVFHFETPGNTQGWQAVNTHVAALASGATPAYAGVGSLRVDFAKTGASFDGPQVRVGNVHGAAGRTVTFRVRVPTLTGSAELLVFTQYGGNWTWRSQAINPTLDSWNTLTLEVPDTSNVQTLGVWLRLAVPQTGTLYIDAVNY
jgi:hypothetical protein